MLSEVIENKFDKLGHLWSADFLIDVLNNNGWVVDLLIHHFDFFKVILIFFLTFFLNETLFNFLDQLPFWIVSLLLFIV